MTSQIMNIQFDSPPMSLIRDVPVRHVPPSGPRRAEHHTLVQRNLPPKQPTAHVVNRAAFSKVAGQGLHTLETVSMQQRRNRLQSL